MLKLATFRGVSSSGEPLVHVFRPGDRLKKTAGILMPKIQNWAKSYKSQDNKVAIVVNALGSSEYWGQNVNGDIFPESALLHDCRKHGGTSHPIDDFIGRPVGPYGYWTFKGAHPFAHHRNKDPNRAFGTVELVEWNPRMHRVELVVLLDRQLAYQHDAGHIIDRIDAGQFPDVSMGCFISGTMVTMADGTRRPIEDIKVGDEVLTHKGRARKVTELHRRKYKGDLYSIKAEAHPLIRCTRSHPFLAYEKGQVKKKDDHANWKWKDKASGDPEWTGASLLRDEYLVEPVRVIRPHGPYPLRGSRAEARLLGYYLAEGHLLRNKSGEVVGIELTTHKDDAVHDEIFDLCEEYGTKNPPATHQRANSEDSVGIYIFDRDLAMVCLRYCSQYSVEKKLSERVIGAPSDYVKELIGAYANGDGCFFDGALKLSTASEDLAWQLSSMLTRIQALPSVSCITHKAGSGFSAQDTYEWVVHIGKQWAPILAPYCAKVEPVEILKPKNSRKRFDDSVITPIREISSMYVETDVYNFEVEEDNSYLVEGIAVHNCKVPYDVCTICGHKSKTRNDYCACVREIGMGKVLDDGRRIGVINLHPRFFDISFVFIGADKSAKMMCKLGSVAPLSVDEADRVYDIPFDENGLIKAACGEGPCRECVKGCHVKTAEPRIAGVSLKESDRILGRGSEVKKTSESRQGKVMDFYLNRAEQQQQENESPLLLSKADDQLQDSSVSDGELMTNAPERAERMEKEAAALGAVFKAAANIKLGPPPSPNRKEFPFVGSLNFRGITIHVENAPGTWRTGKGWKTLMRIPYGEFAKSEGMDGDKLDVYVGPHRKCANAYIVHQNRPREGTYDEDKVMLGFSSPEEAKAAYLAHYNTSKFFRSITTMAFPLFKRALLGGEVDGQKVAALRGHLEKISADMQIEDLFGGGKDYCRRERTWRDKVSGKEVTVKGSGLIVKQASAPEPPDISELLKMSDVEKWSDILKRIGPDKAVGKVSPVLSSSEPDIDPEVLGTMSKLPLEQALTTPSMMGMVLKPQEFQRMMLSRHGRPDLADTLDRAGATFKPVDHEEAPCGSLGQEHLLLPLLKALLPLFGQKSYYGPTLRRRMIRITIIQPSEGSADTELNSPLLTKVGAAYNWYRREHMKLAGDMLEVVPQVPELYSRLYGMDEGNFFHKAAGAEVADPIRALGRAAEKSGIKVNPKALAMILGSIPLTMMYSAHLRGKQRRGESGPIENLIADHPWLTAIGVGVGMKKLMGVPQASRAVDELAGASKRVWYGPGGKTAHGL